MLSYSELFYFGAGVLFLLLGMTIARAASDSASGAMRMAGESFALKHAFALIEADPLAGVDKEKLTVLLSDAPVPDEMREPSDEWRFWADGQAREGALHGIIITIELDTNIWNRGMVLTRNGFMMYSHTCSSPGEGNLRFEPAGPLGQQAAGRISMEHPMEGMDETSGPWSVSAGFQCAVVQRPAVSGVLTGAAAQDSPQAQAALAFLAACKAKDLDAIRGSVDPRFRESLEQMVDQGGAENVLEMFAEMAAENSVLTLSTVTVRGDTAEVEFTDGVPDSENRQSLTVNQAGGEWRLGQ